MFGEAVVEVAERRLALGERFRAMVFQSPCLLPWLTARQNVKLAAGRRRGKTDVDAYLDLNDGQIKGAITNRTRYLIRGDDLVDPARLAAPRKKEAPMEKEEGAEEKKADEKKADEKNAEDKKSEETKEEPAKSEALPDRLKAINEAAAKMRQEAADKGRATMRPRSGGSTAPGSARPCRGRGACARRGRSGSS